MKRIILLSLFTLAVNYLFSQTFTEQTGISLTGVSTCSVAWGDYDNDGDLDILLTGSSTSGNISKIYKNNGDNTFTAQTGISLIGVYSSSVAWGDYDNDGNLDILLTGYSDSKYISKIYKNSGNNSFTEQTGISLKGVCRGSVAWGDYDNDGDLDILLTGDDGFYVISKIYKNNGNNSFTEQTKISLTGVTSSSVAWGDYDNDGDLDILLTGCTNMNGTDQFSKIYRNDGNDTFIPQNGIVLSKVSASSSVWGDYDNDGDLDILLTGYSSSGRISKIYRNDGDNIFSEQAEISLTGVNSSSAAWGDYDNDGDLDILLTGYSNSGRISKIYKNNGDNTFAEQTAISLTGVNAGSVAWGDYDNDGDLDILLTGYTETIGISKIYKNEGSIVNSKPTAPVVSIPIVNKNSVTLSWGMASDAQTLSDGLTYNLFIKNISDGSLAVSPMSDISSGLRRIVQLGNKNHVLSTVQNIDYGDYEWYIQAIDNCFTGSVFSKGQNFTISTLLTPAILTAKASTRSEINLSWVDKSKYEAGYVVERSIGNNQNFIPIDTLNSNSTNYTDRGLTSGILYFYRVKALLNNISSEYCNEANAMISFFEQTGISLSGVRDCSVAWGDYNNDGYLDILMTGYNGSLYPISKIYKNNGNNTFTEQTGISLEGVYYSSVAWGDYDNDGYLDILLTGSADRGGSNYVSKIYKNNGNNTFSEQTKISFTHIAKGSVAWGDYDNDGDLDILLTGSNYDLRVSKIYRNDGNNTFTEQTTIALTGVSSSSVAWGDYDNDGDLDILLSGYSNSGSISKIYKNNGDNTFTEQTGISLTGVYNSSVAWGDYDNDGNIDILLTGDTGSSTISKIYKNNNNNTFTDQTGIKLTRVSGSSVAWGDYDNDGDLDILLTGYSSSSPISKIFKNNGNNTFAEQTAISLNGVSSGSVAWGDYDNDGDLDILLTGGIENGYISRIFKNECSFANSNPSFPNNLAQKVNSNTVTFTWDKANDNETTQNGLSYNLIIKSKEGKIIKSPLSDSISGIRKIVSFGNVGQNNSWTIKDLPEGIYSWSIQAIDHNYAGSKFAPSKTFINSPPLDKPLIHEGDDNFCQNPSNSLYTTSNVPRATSYSWSITPSNAGTITGSTTSATVDWSDTYSGTAKIAVIAQNNLLKSESSDTLIVTISTPLFQSGVITGDQTVCQRTSDYLYKVTAIDGADSYSWTLPQGATGTSTSDNILISFGETAISGNIIVKGQNSCGVGSENSFAVTVNTKPDKPIVTKNGTVLISSATTGNQWYKQDELITGANQQELTSTGDGNYYVIVTESGCTSDPSNVLTITDVEILNSNELVEVYPNPTSQSLSVISVDNAASVEYEFVDLLGKVIRKGNFFGKTVIETGSVIPGVYLLKVKNGKTNEIIKIIKK